MKKTLLKIASFIYPVVCSSCGCDMDALSKERICKKCKDKFIPISEPICAKCGIFLEDGGEHCYICRKNIRTYSFDKMRSAYAYRGNLRKLILKFKYSDRTFLSKDFSKAMCKTMDKYEFYKEVDLIIPVPLNILRRIKRGYNQAELLAEGISAHIDKPVIKNVLLRKKITKPQFNLTKEERLHNIKDSFFIKEKQKSLIYKKNILLVDDIVTTSATVEACSFVLKKAKAAKIYVITLARD